MILNNCKNGSDFINLFVRFRVSGIQSLGKYFRFLSKILELKVITIELYSENAKYIFKEFQNRKRRDAHLFQ